MRKSTFCLCPRGWSPWTLRAYQGMMAGCIPVIIADEIEFPFENFMDWRNLTVGLYKLNSVATHSLKPPGFNPCALHVIYWSPNLLLSNSACTAT
jgi:hypothetical protein